MQSILGYLLIYYLMHLTSMFSPTRCDLNLYKTNEMRITPDLAVDPVLPRFPHRLSNPTNPVLSDRNPHPMWQGGCILSCRMLASPLADASLPLLASVRPWLWPPLHRFVLEAQCLLAGTRPLSESQLPGPCLLTTKWKKKEGEGSRRRQPRLPFQTLACPLPKPGLVLTRYPVQSGLLNRPGPKTSWGQKRFT